MADGKWHFTHTNNYYTASGTRNGSVYVPGYMGYESVRGASSGTLLVHTETKHWLSASSSYNPVYPPSGTTSSGSEDGQWADTFSDYSYHWGGAALTPGARLATNTLTNRDGQSVAVTARSTTQQSGRSACRSATSASAAADRGSAGGEDFLVTIVPRYPPNAYGTGGAG